MIKVRNTLVSDDLAEVSFCCDLPRCLGACCVEGDAGAPLEEEEISLIEDELENIKPYMTERGKETVAKTGVFDYDAGGHFVTPLVNDAECAFTNFTDGVAWCAIERAFQEGKTELPKPISCHLYPVRILKKDDLTAVNYHKWNICKPALKKGRKENLPLYIFLKDALVRYFGESWYQELKSKIENRQSKIDNL
jgi:hypothetical protein